MVLSKNIAVETAPLFEYDPLPDANAYIRVLRILQDDFDSPLRLTIGNLCLDSADEYICLSYTWGIDEASNTIPINNQRFLVRDNLRNFLLEARRKRVDHLLWIDAITINQNDVNEKNSQVALMGHIYKQATRVIAWLGQGDDDVGAAFDLIKSSADLGALSFKELYEDKFDDAPKQAAVHQMKTRATGKQYWDVFDHVSSLEYFQRLWIVQEILLAKRLSLWYGDTSFEGGFMENLCEFITRLPISSLDIKNQGLAKIKQKTCGAIFQSRMHEESHGIKSTFPVFRRQKCYEPKDKIYGLKSLDNNMETFPVDYNVDNLWLIPQLYDHCMIEGVDLGFFVLKELGVSHVDLFEATRDLGVFSGRQWKFNLQDVGIVGDCTETQTGLIFEVDWEDLQLPETEIGEYCQYIKRVSTPKASLNPSVATRLQSLDLILRQGAMNVFYVYRHRNISDSSPLAPLLDDIHEKTPEDRYANKRDIENLKVELSQYRFVTTLMVHEDHQERLSNEIDKDVGKGFTEPLQLSFLTIDSFHTEFQRLKLTATVFHYQICIDWRCLLTYWRLCDAPGSMREELVEEYIGSWDEEVQKLEYRGNSSNFKCS